MDRENRTILGNILGAFVIKGGALVIQLLLLPAYMAFFQSEQVLGLWYTLVALLNWLTLFDLGLGHSLRNKLPPLLEGGDRQGVRICISTTYLAVGALSAALLAVSLPLAGRISWDRVFDIPLPEDLLKRSVRTLLVGMGASLLLRNITAIAYAQGHSALVGGLQLGTSLLMLLALWALPHRSDGENLLALCRANALALNLPAVVYTAVVFGKSLRDCLPSVKWFRRDRLRGILGEGVTLLWLNVVFLAVSSANELLITFLSGAEYVVEYQVYHKIFNTAGLAVSLALTPVWSAVTRAGVRGDYAWIRKIYRLFLVGTGLCFLGELAILPFLGRIVKLWLGEGAMGVRTEYGFLFCLLSSLFVLHNVNTSVSNGLSWYRLQGIWMTLAAAVFFPLAWLLTRWIGSWIGIILANVISVLPYEILAPVVNLRKLKKESGGS